MAAVTDATAEEFPTTQNIAKFEGILQVGTGFPGGEVIVPAPNLLFPYPDGYRPATMAVPAPP
jgi:hypothetical protein